jgi:hypothetical protein
MKRISTLITRSFFIIVICLSFTVLHAQSGFKTKQVIIASGGKFGDPNNYVRIGSFNPDTKIYTVFDSVHSTSTRSILIDGKYAYITADTLLLKYDIDNYTRVAKGSSTGLNTPGGYLAQYNDYILATRAFGATQSYLVAYNKSDLKEAFAITGISDQASGIAVVGDTAYVGVSGVYNKDSGYIAVVDLKNRQWKREILLDTMGAQIGKIFTDGTNIYTVNSKRSVVTIYNIATGNISHHVFYKSQYGSGNGIAFNDNKVYTDFGYLGIGSYNVENGNISNSFVVNYNDIPGFNTFSNFVAGAALDTINNLFYVTTTDYASAGTTYVFDMNGNAVDTFAVGISPEAIAIDYRSPLGIKETNTQILTINAYPNPVKNALHIVTANLVNVQITITDISGKTLLAKTAENNSSVTEIDVQSLPAGMYIINLRYAAGNGFAKFIKQ